MAAVEASENSEVRAALEGYAARLAAERATDDEIAAVAAVHHTPRLELGNNRIAATDEGLIKPSVGQPEQLAVFHQIIVGRTGHANAGGEGKARLLVAALCAQLLHKGESPLADGVQREPFVRKVDTNLYSVGMITPLGEIADPELAAIVARHHGIWSQEAEAYLLAHAEDITHD